MPLIPGISWDNGGCFSSTKQGEEYLKQLEVAGLLKQSGEKKYIPFGTITSMPPSPSDYVTSAYFTLTETGNKYFNPLLHTFSYGHKTVDKITNSKITDLKDGSNTYSEATISYSYHIAFDPWVNQEKDKELFKDLRLSGTAKTVLRSVNGSDWN